MSKRTFFTIIITIIVTAALTLGVLGWFGGWFDRGDPVYTAEIPKSRPKRLDWRLLSQFQGQSMQEIIAALEKQKELVAGTEAPPAGDPLLAMLPDAPLPYPEDAAPRDEDGLKNFISNIQKGTDTPPTKEELWKFNLALAAMKIPSSQVPEALRLNTEPAPESDTFAVDLAPKDLAEMAGPFAIGDFDGKPGNELVSNGGSRLNLVDETGAMTPTATWNEIAPGDKLFPADFDNDGDLDLFIIRGEGFPNSLLRNNGAGAVEDITIESGLLSFNDTTSAAWFDYDSDGLLDLLVGSRDHPLELYHQTSNGPFQPIAWDLKLWVHEGVEAITVTDVSGDGYPDFYLSLSGQDDRLAVSTPAPTWDQWRFEDRLTEMEIALDETPADAVFFDFNNDGHTDLLTAGDTLRLYQNGGEQRFVDITEEIELKTNAPVRSLAVADIDGDGYEDILAGTTAFAANEVFWNRGGTSFREVSVASQASYLDEPVEILSGDLDGNGMLDLVFSHTDGSARWLESIGGYDHWLQLSLKNHRPGTRALITVRDTDWVLGDLSRRFDLNSEITIGLGSADLVEAIAIFPPEGGEPLEQREKIEPNQRIEIELPAEPTKRPVVPMAAE